MSYMATVVQKVRKMAWRLVEGKELHKNRDKKAVIADLRACHRK